MTSAIFRLGESLKNGPLNTTVYYIWKHLVDGHQSMAETEYQQDGDKIPRYYLKYIEPLLGCRLHLTKNCQQQFCSRIEKYEY